jgi:signal transduction histidine kinase
MISLHIQDNGSGISSSELGRIFEKGFTGTNGKLNEKATGMGLYLCKTLCNKLYLGIRAESVQGQGTTIILDFPISKLMLLK